MYPNHKFAIVLDFISMVFTSYILLSWNVITSLVHIALFVFTILFALHTYTFLFFFINTSFAKITL